MISEFKVRLFLEKQNEFGFAEVFSMALLGFCLWLLCVFQKFFKRKFVYSNIKEKDSGGIG